ncbi:hypothetical protein SAN_1110 [Streptococcus agalactiae COH1]|nr:hypothetical protein SAN_1110 [Streptococcus agalactiae COH1]
MGGDIPEGSLFYGYSRLILRILWVIFF